MSLFQIFPILEAEMPLNGYLDKNLRGRYRWCRTSLQISSPQGQVARTIGQYRHLQLIALLAKNYSKLEGNHLSRNLRYNLPSSVAAKAGITNAIYENKKIDELEPKDLVHMAELMSSSVRSV